MKVYCHFVWQWVYESLALALRVFYLQIFIFHALLLQLELCPYENKSNVKCVGRDRLMCLSSPAWLNIAHHYCQHRERERKGLWEQMSAGNRQNERHWKRRDRFRLMCESEGMDDKLVKTLQVNLLLEHLIPD